MSTEHIDVIIVGAGLSGIAAAYYLQTRCAQKSYTILEARNAMGGTWDLFRYPGIRSDSDMYTLGYTFRPWDDPQAIADGPSILKYIHETAEAYDIDKAIRYGHRVCGASWSSEDSLWTVEVENGTESHHMTCKFLFMCTGYYDYDKGYTPDFPNVEQYKGQIIHPQEWDEALDYSAKRVIVIGSGATAVTLVPAMSEQAEHVTMLQRSPTYIVSRPSEDAQANWLNNHLPKRLAYTLIRWRIILFGMYVYFMTRWKLERVKQQIIDLVREELGEDYDVDTHFTPTYNPWDQRLCLVPDSDLFNAIKARKVSIVTDHIEQFTEKGILLKSGKTLEADIIITATGLVMSILNGIQLVVDGEAIHVSDSFTYKGMMYSNIPNLATSFGYTNASWTLKCELICEYVCRLLNYMDKHGYTQSTPRPQQSVTEAPFINFTSGYVQRALDALPNQGSERPWKADQNYVIDLMNLRYGRLNDGAMEFSKKKVQQAERVPAL